MAEKYYKRFRIKLKDVFNFSRSEIRGICVLLAIIFIIIIVLSIIIIDNNKNTSFDEQQNETIVAFLERQRQIADSLEESRKNKIYFYPKNYAYSKEYNKTATKTKLHLFNFCPDTMSINDWKRLGFNNKNAEQIYKYLSKRGKIQKKEDLLKIYCIDESIFAQLYDYIQIDNQPNVQTSTKSEPKPQSKKKLAINLNKCDTAELQKIYGIGPKISTKIVNYRQKLGGFYCIEQIQEILKDSTKYKQIKDYLFVNQNDIKIININTASEKTLASHPYIEPWLAKEIVTTRQKKGKFKSIAEIKDVIFIYDNLFNKLVPYLSVND